MNRYFILGAVMVTALWACNGHKKTRGKSEILQDSIQITKEKTVRVNVYLENTGSLNGFVKVNSEYKTGIADLLGLLNYYYGQQNVKLSFINTTVIPVEKPDLVTFIQNLTQKEFVKGNTSASNLNQIIDTVLSRTDKNTISILVSDCIYSTGCGSYNDQDLALQGKKTLTKGAFLKASTSKKLTLETVFIKMMSNFDGYYWGSSCKPTPIGPVQRPFYIAVLGSHKLLSGFNGKIPVGPRNLNGYSNKYLLTSMDYSDDIYYSVLTSTLATASIKEMRDRNLSSTGYVHGIEVGRENRGESDKLRFAVAVNLTPLQLEDDYLASKKNYQIENGNYSLDEISLVDTTKRVIKLESGEVNINPSDWNKIKGHGVSHVLILTSKSRALSDLKISIKKQVPNWVVQTNTNIDSPGEAIKGKTFGIKYLIGGIQEAYDILGKKDYYVQLSIPIKRNSGAPVWLIILGVIILVPSMILFTLKSRKK